MCFLLVPASVSWKRVLGGVAALEMEEKDASRFCLCGRYLLSLPVVSPSSLGFLWPLLTVRVHQNTGLLRSLAFLMSQVISASFSGRQLGRVPSITYRGQVTRALQSPLAQTLPLTDI